MAVTPQELLRSPARSASGPRIFGALVQPAYSVAAESLPIDLQASPGKKFGREFLDRETDGIRGASKSSVPDGLPAPPPPGGKSLRLASGRGQLGLGVVIKREHVLGPVGQANDVMDGMDLTRISHSLDAPWLDLCPAIAFSPLANTSSIGGGAQNRWRAKSLRHDHAIL